MRPLSYLVALSALAACGGDSNNNNQNDAAVDASVDAAIDAPPAPQTITLTGTVTERNLQGSVAVSGAAVEAFSNADEATPVATATTDAQGNFTLTVETGGVALAGYLKASRQNLKDSYLYPPTFIEGDIAMIPILMVNAGTYDALSTLAQGNQMSQNGLIALQVVDGIPPDANPVEGATVSSNPAAGVVRYSNAQGLPSSQAQATGTDGIAYLFNVPPNVPVEVSAAKAGSTFASHTVAKARPDSLTLTFIQPAP
jgi:hypothetical protein